MSKRTDLVAVAGGAEATAYPSAGERQTAAAPGQLEGLLSAAPCFRSSVRGYDRIQVDNYVAWVETELTVSRRQNDELLARLGACAAELEAARRAAQGRGPSGPAGPIAELLRRAAEEARQVTERAAAEAARITGAASDEARRTTASALEEADRLTESAVEEADRVLAEARLEAEARLRKADAIIEAATVAAQERLAAAEREVAEARRQRDQARESLRLLTARIGAALQGVVLVADDDGEVRAQLPERVG